jgi:hypothetical protein
MERWFSSKQNVKGTGREDLMYAVRRKVRSMYVLKQFHDSQYQRTAASLLINSIANNSTLVIASKRIFAIGRLCGTVTPLDLNT